jgi:2-keto-4-pentenoate hydratase/2-oxohepta-3-ene-1,7-dioic acid hydratase in catechol pathway
MQLRGEMKLLRVGEKDMERPAILDEEDKLRDLSSIVPDIAGQVLSAKSLLRIRSLELASLPLLPEGIRIGPCVGSVRNFIAVGLNYPDHALESKMAAPAEPVLFNKAPSCVAGPNDDILIPPGSVKTDWEVELAVVISDRAFRVSEENALDLVAGYCVCNDLSERAYQLHGTGQWMKGKSYPTFGPLGPWLVTKDEIADVQSLNLWLDLNSKRVQNGNTATMTFGVAYLVSYVSHFMILEPGDVITTGTPPGVGLGMKPPVYLKPGDTLRLGIEGLGMQSSKAVETRV